MFVGIPGMTAGWVYIMKNKGMPGLLKIGMTTRTPEARAQELSSTGVPHPFEVCFAVRVSDCHAVETKLHLALETFRVNNRREFFKMTLGQARRRVKGAAAAHRLRDKLDSPVMRSVGVLILLGLVAGLVYMLGGISGLELLYNNALNTQFAWGDIPYYPTLIYHDPMVFWKFAPFVLGIALMLVLVLRPSQRDEHQHKMRRLRIQRYNNRRRRR